METTSARILSAPHPTGDLLYSSPTHPEHGGVVVAEPEFARDAIWTVAGDTAQLTRDGITLTYSVIRGRFELSARNDSPAPPPIRLALRPYWRVDAVRARAIGLSGSEVFDKVTGSSRVVSGDLRFGSEVDAVVRSQGPVLLDDGNRWIRIETSGTDHTVVWNPGPEACADAPDLGDEEWREFVCVEPALLGADRGGVSVAPGETAGISMRVTAGPVGGE